MKCFEDYAPDFTDRILKNGELIYPLENANIEFEELELTEANPNLYGNISAALILLSIVIFLCIMAANGKLTVTYENNYDIAFGIIVCIFLLFSCIGLTYKTIGKLKYNSNRGKLLVDCKGITVNTIHTTNKSKYTWDNIEQIALKVYYRNYKSSTFHIYLLILLKDEVLKDYDISLFKKPLTSKTSKRNYINTMITKPDQYNDLRKIIGKYMNKPSA